ncbi:antibiotic biosynthesis monooxygenase [Mycolicibacterium sp. 018/SC-01/001]|uniref:antibiotic biosynthesis monooxygenase n=1 Tax=Mycolicibacterium sp. 018/SC-01/001 TaxID=2592069 RepID=UPI00117ED3FC|nr:antibiotic biosynthesis monooxygenase [Mycolicibacterium sp. 018/SC-01/001]TRW77275.1 antibiotic biosynthesis monooxygenase [Mycolicibacterium sp. 018/SC-01/001]
MSAATPVTAVTVFHRPGDPAGFDGWAQHLLASAGSSPGHTWGRVSVHDDPMLDSAVAVTFSDEEMLHAWLDSPVRAQILADGQARGYWQAAVDVVVPAGGPASPGVGAFRHTVADGKAADFTAMQIRLARAACGLPGYEGTTVLPADRNGEWMSIVRFRTGGQLAAWLSSAARSGALTGLRDTLSGDFSVVSNTTPFGTTVRMQDGRAVMTPNWKSAMLVLLVLYPTVMLLSRFLGPFLDGAGAQPWLSLWVSQIVSIIAMQWWLMPAASRPFQRWLDPIDGAGAGLSLRGAAVIVVGYALTLTLFATVHELQFWDYAS